LGGKIFVTYTVAAISMKFVLYLIFVVLLILATKNRSWEFILTFFVIYLSFTIFLVFSLTKLLRTRKLDGK
jgi:lipopolysaccharide export LptBFGC system permease protein LptF